MLASLQVVENVQNLALRRFSHFPLCVYLPCVHDFCAYRVLLTYWIIVVVMFFSLPNQQLRYQIYDYQFLHPAIMLILLYELKNNDVS